MQKPTQKPTQKAVFLDRDGVINVDTGYPYRIEDLQLIEGAAAAIARARAAGYMVPVVTNQGGIALGHFTHAALAEFHRHLREALAAEAAGAVLDDIAYCPHHPDAGDDCAHRKPAPGMILALAAKHDIDLARSALIGDRDSDIAAARAAGVGRAYLFTGGNLDMLMAKVLAEMETETETETGHE